MANENGKKYLIWSSDYDVEDFRNDFEELCPDGSETELYDYAQEINQSYLSDEKMNLKKELDADMLIIGTLGLWDGRRPAYAIIKDANLNDFLSRGCYKSTFYGDGENILMDNAHNDGTNHFIIRKASKGSLDLDLLDDYIYGGQKESMQAHEKLMEQTESIFPLVANVYGWGKLSVPVGKA